MSKAKRKTFIKKKKSQKKNKNLSRQGLGCEMT